MSEIGLLLQEGEDSTDAGDASFPPLSAFVVSLSIFSSFVAMLSSGAEFAYALYSVDLKSALDCNQEWEELLASAVMLFSCMGPLNGFCIFNLSQKLNCLIGTLCLCSGYFYVYVAIRLMYLRSLWLVTVAFCLIGFGTGLMYAVGLDNIVHSVSKSSRGRVVSLMAATASVSCAVFACLYDSLFSQSTQKPSGYLLFLTLVMLVSGVVSSAFMRRTRSNRSDAIVSTVSAPKPMLKVLRGSITSSFFWLVLVLLFIQSGIGSMHLLNVGEIVASISASRNIAASSRRAVIIAALSSSVGRAAIAISDFTPGLRRGYWALLTMLLSLASSVGAFFGSDSLSVIDLCTVGFGMSYGSTWALYPILVSEEFAVQHFSQIWGLLSLAPGVGSAFFNLIAGALYDMHAEGANCEGPACYSDMYALATVVSLIGTVLLFWLIPMTKYIPLRGGGDTSASTDSLLSRDSVDA